IEHFDCVLGLNLIKQAEKINKDSRVPVKIQELGDKRWALKQSGKYSEADALRLELAKKGFQIEDKCDSYIILKKS
ncbi:MAG: hypothetical protein AAB880_00495, partial [Patescibacteria group bacterium]